ncbi:hypothetical protein [Escherichia phage EK010]|uniref:Uncharacterized protein n=2 Tax=Suseptimavirus TaxID=3044836 RepID=A0A6J4EIV8_9CAUD|nr:hypothetical protein ECBP2_0038 [Escherichia phage ECBP2]YP_010672990.1 hypothetical protein PQC42_gp057 [Escherichia phage EK010]AFR52071.1 hypothetical protein ECBP2_0038 [Escherichia phage ECBP2]UYE89944.1 hypothetical protein [Escherichia phage E20-1]BCG45006.1 hypothetical protein [Escherichia phage EK010]
MSKEYIVKAEGKGLFQFVTDATDYGQLINFVELAKLKEEIDALYADEQSRLLQESLSGDYICDGCTI